MFTKGSSLEQWRPSRPSHDSSLRRVDGPQIEKRRTAADTTLESRCTGVRGDETAAQKQPQEGNTQLRKKGWKYTFWLIACNSPKSSRQRLTPIGTEKLLSGRTQSEVQLDGAPGRCPGFLGGSVCDPAQTRLLLPPQLAGEEERQALPLPLCEPWAARHWAARGGRVPSQATQSTVEGPRGRTGGRSGNSWLPHGLGATLLPLHSAGRSFRACTVYFP